jgi:hypothetical protein
MNIYSGCVTIVTNQKLVLGGNVGEKEEKALRWEIRNGLRDLFDSKSFNTIATINFLCQTLYMTKYDLIDFVRNDELCQHKYECLKQFYLDHM